MSDTGRVGMSAGSATPAFPIGSCLTFLVLRCGWAAQIGLVLAASSLALGLSGCSASSSSEVATTCTSSQLGTSLGQNGAGAGQRGFVVIFRNTSASMCHIEGYPSMIAYDESGAPGVKAQRSKDAQAPPLVTLAPGGSASVLIQTGGVQVNGIKCVTSKSLRVTPPQATRSKMLALQWTATQGPLAGSGLYACGPMYVGPVTAGIVAFH